MLNIFFQLYFLYTKHSGYEKPQETHIIDLKAMIPCGQCRFGLCHLTYMHLKILMNDLFNKFKNKITVKKASKIMAAFLVMILSLSICCASVYSGIEKPSLIAEESSSQEETTQPETETTQAETEEETQSIVTLSLVGTSSELDLKIKIRDQDEELATGEVFEIYVAPEDDEENSVSYTDDDKDGIIYIDPIDAGDYVVTLCEIEGYEIEQGTIYVTVNDQIVYEVVDVTDEIKEESEINVEEDDTAARIVSSASDDSGSEDVSDTTASSATASSSETTTTAETTSSSADEVLESTMTARSVDRSAVDTSSFPASSVSGSSSASLSDIEISIPESAVLYNSTLSSSNSAQLDITLDPEGSSDSLAFAWSSSDESIVSVSANDSGALISYVSNGSAQVTLTVTDTDADTEENSVTLTCTVTAQDYTDTTQLTDTSGNLLYLDETASTAATVADYMTTETFYLTPLYTGWQTIDGTVYYFDENNEYVTGIQTIGGTLYTFASDGALQTGEVTLGIDVSKWQGNIDWEAVADAGIDFVIIRAGYRGSTSGSLVEDSYFEANIKGAIAAGIKVGVYFFTQAITEAEAVEEASMVVSLVSGYKLTYPIFIDTESSGGRADSLSKSARTAIIKAFCETVQSAGYKAGVYASKNWFLNKLNASSLSSYYIWVAQYNDTCTYTGSFDMWQYSSSGSVNGISGNVDMDISYLGF